MAARAKVHFPRVQPSEASGSVGQMTNQPFDHLVGAASEPLPRPPGDAEGAPLAGKPFADFSTRDGVLMTVAGLVALLPLSDFGTSDPSRLEVLKHFFLWVYPFLFVSVISFFLGTSRVHTLRDVLPIPEENTVEDFIDTFNQCFGAQNAWLRRANVIGARCSGIELQVSRYCCISLRSRFTSERYFL
jgi:hypothetical protein